MNYYFHEYVINLKRDNVLIHGTLHICLCKRNYNKLKLLNHDFRSHGIRNQNKIISESNNYNVSI